MSVEITRLDNAIHIITDDYPHLETTALGVWVRAGARDEAIAQNGVAHLIEHMAFKGTPTRSARQIAEEIEAAGGDLNASTAMENTGYYARVLKDDWELALDILADILTAPVFDATELERERGVILQEIAATADTPDDLVFDLAQQACFPDHPLGRTILGPAPQVARYGVSDIEAYRSAHYHGARMVIAAAGRIDHRRFAARARDLFGAIPAGVPAAWQPARFEGGIRQAAKPLEQAHVVLGFPAVGYRHDDIYGLQVLANLLGGGMSSRLFQEVREQRGLCYSVFSHAAAYQDGGLMAVYAGTAPETLGELLGVVSDVMLRVADRVEESEVSRARAQLKAGLVMSLESPAARADQIARQFLAFGKVPPIADIVARVEAVTAHDVSRLAAGLFAERKIALGAVGALNGLAQWDRIAARFH